MKKTILPIALVALVGSTILVAQDEDPRQRRGPRFDAIQEALDLTDEQVTALQENGKALRESMRAVMEGTKETREALRTEMQLESPNPAIVGQYMIDLKNVRDEVKALRDASRESALTVLTDEQKATLAELEAAAERAPVAMQARGLNLLEGQERGEGRRGPRGRRGPGGPGFGPF